MAIKLVFKKGTQFYFKMRSTADVIPNYRIKLDPLHSYDSNYPKMDFYVDFQDIKALDKNEPSITLKDDVHFIRVLNDWLEFKDIDTIGLQPLDCYVVSMVNTETGEILWERRGEKSNEGIGGEDR